MAKILVVDDDPDFVEAMRLTLERNGYTVVSAADGDEGLVKVRSERPDLVILDVIMPGMGGMETFEAIKARNPDVKVILSSGYSVNHIAKEIMDRGCRAFIQKPFNIETISKKVRDVLQEA